MIIKSLEIYGYGQFVHRKIEFNREFTEIFGENEAGDYPYGVQVEVLFLFSLESQKV
jgi:hypothetical protein